MKNITKNITSQKLNILIGLCIIASAILGIGYRCFSLLMAEIKSIGLFNSSMLNSVIVLIGISSLIIAFFAFRIIPLLNIKRTIGCGILCSSFSYFIYALAQNDFMIVLGAVIMGIGFSLSGYMCLQLIVLHYFPENSGKALGLIGGTVCLFTIIASPIWAWLLNNLGWRSSAVFAGVLILISGMSALYALMRDLPTDLCKYSYKSLFFEFRHNKDLHSKSFYILITFCLLASFINQGFLMHNALIITNKGFPMELAAISIAISALSGSISRILAGVISDRFNFKIVCFYTFACLIAAMLLLWQASSDLHIILYSIFFGFYGVLSVLGGALGVKKLFHQKNYTIMQGMSRAAGECGKLLAALCIAFIFAATASYDIFILLSVFAAIIILVLSRMIFS